MALVEITITAAASFMPSANTCTATELQDWTKAIGNTLRHRLSLKAVHLGLGMISEKQITLRFALAHPCDCGPDIAVDVRVSRSILQSGCSQLPDPDHWAEVINFDVDSAWHEIAERNQSPHGPPDCRMDINATVAQGITWHRNPAGQ